MEYIKSPLDAKALMNGKRHPRCSAENSIKQHLHMMLVTYQGELHEHRDFGNALLEEDFRNGLLKCDGDLILYQSLIANIKKFEPRLKDPNVKVAFSENDIRDDEIRGVKIRVDVLITGTNIVTLAPFRFVSHFYVAPISY